MRNEGIIPIMSSAYRNRLADLGKNWGWLMAGGIGFIVLGVAAYLWPVHSTVALTLVMGWFFLIGGIVRLVEAVRLRKLIGTGWRVFDSLLSVAAGILVLRFPAGGMLAVAIAMIFFFFMSAVAKATLAFATRPHPGSGWALVSAIASLVLGIYMIATFPVSALWIPGLLLGIDFVIYGISLIGVSFGLRKLHREIPPAAEEPIQIRKAA